ncbi:MAG: PDZ domain-containing protein [Bacteroidales bacterium]|jgi:tricorn protease|nr:PDZ domain-containing protein [Bacteroidales bacterium]
MKRKIFFPALIGVLLFIAAQDIAGINTSDTRMLSQPAVSQSHIAFIYAEDLWVMNTDGTNPIRLTVDEGIESDPCFSPDGKLIAFSAQYDGNTDVFIIPAEGGVPVRLTWHPGSDMVRGFTPDGKKVLFISQRSSFTSRYWQLFTVDLSGSYPEKLDIPNAYYASYSPDGKKMAYTPLSPAHDQWKNYRGGRVSAIWLYTFADHSVVKIPKPEGGCNDMEPMWINDMVYFLSDRNGEFNLFSFNNNGGEVNQLTHFSDFPVLNASATGSMIVFEQAGYLHTFDTGSGTTRRLTVAIAADLLELRPRYVKGADYIRSADISPTGSRVVFDYRGEIVTLPAEKGDQRNITQTPGAHERFPSWSPDGKTIAYFSDASGENTLHLEPQDGKGEPRIFTLPGTGFYAFPKWSPDSKKICFTDNGRNLYLLDIPSSIISKIDSDELYFPGTFRNMFGDWSSDSKWIVYTKLSSTFFRVVNLYSLDQQKSFPVTDGLSDASEPVFDPNGEYIYFFASTDAGPVINWFDLSSADMKRTNSIYLVTLRRDISSPFAKESDEEKGIEEKTETDKPAAVTPARSSKKNSGKAAAPDENSNLLKIETSGLQDRIVNVPVSAGSFEGLGVAGTGEILYIVRSQGDGASTLHKYTVKDRKDEEVMELDNYIVSSDRKKMLYFKGQTTGITAAGKKPEPGKGTVNTGSLTVKTDPAAEWPQIFNEAWRINRDYFYDPGMHGTDWEAMKEKYSQFLPDLACRSDLNRVIQWLCSELGVGHHRVSGGERLNAPMRIGGGLLGADFALENNRYRLKKIYGGLNWSPDLRSPLTEPGLNVKAGDYILAIDGKDVTADKNIYSFLENTEGKIVELTIGADPGYTGSRVIKVVPIASESSLRNRDWVEGNLRKVTEATDGKVAYVYVPNTADAGHEYFKRYFFPQADRKAIIIDERFNGGGLIADYYIDLLQRPLQSYWNMRYGMDLKTPSASIQGPKVMIIDETAGSGGDMLPWMFRKFSVGTLVGKRTWGGLVGTLGFPELMDGGSVTAPNLAIWTEEGYVVENVGVAPDIEVEQWPAEIIEGRDPQLEKAIEVALKELEKNPPKEPVRPPYPVKGWEKEELRIKN